MKTNNIIWDAAGITYTWSRRKVFMAVFLIASMAIRIWFGNLMGSWYSFGPHDDLWFLRVASLLRYFNGGLEAELGTRMMIKELMFPLFLLITHFSGLSFAAAVSVLWCVAAFMSFRLVGCLTKNREVKLFAFIFVLWCPIGFDFMNASRVYRNSILTPLVAIVFCQALLFYFRLLKDREMNPKRYLGLAIAFGLSFFFTAFIKEDGMWLAVCLAAAITLYFILIVLRLGRDRKSCAKMLLVAALPAIIYGGGDSIQARKLPVLWRLRNEYPHLIGAGGVCQQRL